MADAIEGPKSTERLVFFSDAVFAIAMTLLVLEIPRPSPGQDVSRFLTTQDGKFFAYAISFWVIALFWFGHHRLFRHVREVDQGLIAINLFLLFCVAFIPYPSAILGDRGDDTAATIFYAGVIALAALASATLSWWAVVHRRLAGRVPPVMAWYYVSRGLIVSVVFLVSIPIALVDTGWAHMVWLVSFVLQWLGRRFAERRAGVPDSG